jgi:translation initiation factor IF-3
LPLPEALCYPPAATAARAAACLSRRSRNGRIVFVIATKGPAIARDLRVNQLIRIPQVRVVDEEGTQLGVMPTPRALEMAQERGYDLVEVAPMASPPVARFLDFGQYKYELTKREKEAKKRQRVGFKEVRLSPKIGQGDFDTKVHRAIEFLEEGDRIKVTVRFRGRELTHPELGRNLLTKFTETIKEHGTVERAPLLEGKQMHVTVASLHKPKVHEAAQPGRPAPAVARPGPAQAAPAQARPAAQASSAETKSAEAKPAEAKPAEAKPAEATPVEATKSKPAVEAAESKPAASATQTAHGRQATAVSTGE